MYVHCGARLGTGAWCVASAATLVGRLAGMRHLRGCVMLRIATVAGERGVFCLDRGDEREESPFLYVENETCRRGERARVLLALADPVERAPGDVSAAREIIEGLCVEIDGCEPEDVIGALHTAFAGLSRWLLSQNRANGGRRKIFLGLTCVVGCGDDLFIAQVPPGQALIRQDGRLFAFPRLRSWLPTFQPSQTYELPNPLGLREVTEPQVYYSRVVPGDLLAVISSSLAARLEPMEDEIRDAAGAEDVIDTLSDLCDRHGLMSGVAGIVHV